TAKLKMHITDVLTAPIDAEIFVVPGDEATRATTEGSFHGELGVCAPWLGVPSGPSPACNRFLVWHATQGATEVEMPLGLYDLYAYHGPFFSVAQVQVRLVDADVSVELQLRDLHLKPPGTLSGDFHVHGAASFDSSIPDWDRVLSFAA